MDKRGEYQDFPSNFFSLTVPKSFVGEPFVVTLFLGNGKFNASEGYVTMFRQKFFPIVPKSAVGKPFSVSLFSGNGKILMRG